MYNFRDYEETSFVYSKPIKINEKYNRVNLFYKNNKEKNKIIIQSPPMFVPFDINNEYNTISISFSKKNVNNGVMKFYNFMDYLDKINKQIIKKKKKCWFNNKKFVYKPIIKNYKKICDFVSLEIPKNKNGDYKFNIFNKNLEKITMDKITKNSEISIIAELSYIWINNKKKKIGCHWTVLQIKTYDSLNFDECLILDDDEDEKTDNIDDNKQISDNKIEDSIYEKYLKMLKMGIPLIAVKNNMLRDGVNKVYIDNLSNDLNDCKSELLKKKKIKNSNKLLLSSNNVLMDMKSKLKKGKKIKKLKNDGFAPSLKDIQDILSKLKKPKIKRKKHNLIQLLDDIN